MGLLIMKDYLAIIRKLDFVDLFKYGQFGINYAVAFDGDINAHADDDELFDTLTSKMNLYEYSFEYLIIHFKAQEDNTQYKLIEIQNVQGIYTFDTEAKKEMSISFDPRIQLHVSPWVDKFKKLQQKLTIKQSMRGVDNLWAIFGLSEEDRKKCEQLITTETVQEVFRELYTNERPSGDLSIWAYLLRYERHSFYPKEMLGHFCDAIHVFCNYSKKVELSGEVAETTQVYPKLLECKDSKLASLYDIIKYSPFSKMTEEVSSCRFALAAPLFLYLKSEFSDGMEHKPSKDIISYSKKIGEFECSIAVFLLGLALGYDKTYDAFYEAAELPFFKKKIETPSLTETPAGLENTCTPFSNDSEKSDKEVNLADEKNLESNDVSKKDEIAGQPKSDGNKPINVQEALFDTESESDNRKHPIAWMRKGTGKKADIQPAYTELELNKFDGLGYKKVEQFNDRVKEIISSYGFDPKSEKERFAKKRKSNT